MPYAFMNLRRVEEGEGWEPDFPEGVSFCLLADLKSVRWGLYEFELSESNERWSPEGLVDEQLSALMVSGTKYPPALAIARDSVQHRFADAVPTQREFVTAYGETLRKTLSQQSTAPFLLARAVEEEPGYLTRDEWYWILRIHGDPPVACWVSDDYFVYENAATCFDLTPEQIEKLRGPGGPRGTS